MFGHMRQEKPEQLGDCKPQRMQKEPGGFKRGNYKPLV
jgi:hypothetical protein